MAEQNSTKLEWRAEPGADFWWDGAVWDIAEAKAMLESIPHPIVSFDVSAAVAELDSVGIRWDALDKANLAFPLIVGWLDGKPLVIDGWHRIARCSTLGLPPSLPAVILTQAENAALQIPWSI